MPEISVVAPVYNQRPATLTELVRRLSASISTISEDFEIILIDDGSTNDAWHSISGMAQANPKVRGFQLSRNFGQHVAISAGLDHADGNWVVVMDADLQDRPEVIRNYMPRRSRVMMSCSSTVRKGRNPSSTEKSPLPFT